MRMLSEILKRRLKTIILVVKNYFNQFKIIYNSCSFESIIFILYSDSKIERCLR